MQNKIHFEDSSRSLTEMGFEKKSIEKMFPLRQETKNKRRVDRWHSVSTCRVGGSVSGNVRRRDRYDRTAGTAPLASLNLAAPESFQERGSLLNEPPRRNKNGGRKKFGPRRTDGSTGCWTKLIGKWFIFGWHYFITPRGKPPPPPPSPIKK